MLNVELAEEEEEPLDKEATACPSLLLEFFS